jgi:hypothetical protein
MIIIITIMIQLFILNVLSQHMQAGIAGTKKH